MYQQLLAAGEYNSTAEYDIILALAREEYETDVAREEYMQEIALSDGE